MYICVEKRFGRLEGVSHRVNGMRDAVSGMALCWWSQSWNEIS